MTTTIDSLSTFQLTSNPVWEYTNDAGPDTEIAPVNNLPVNTLTNRVVGSKVKLANGEMLKTSRLTNE